MLDPIYPQTHVAHQRPLHFSKTFTELHLHIEMKPWVVIFFLPDPWRVSSHSCFDLSGISCQRVGKCVHESALESFLFFVVVFFFWDNRCCPCLFRFVTCVLRGWFFPHMFSYFVKTSCCQWIVQHVAKNLRDFTKQFENVLCSHWVLPCRLKVLVLLFSAAWGCRLVPGCGQ